MAWITAQLTAIGVELGEEVSPARLRLMAERLSSEAPGMLQIAFSQFMETTGDHFPKPAELLRIIRNAEFTADYAWLLENLKEHGPMWKDSQAVLGELRRIPGGTPDDFYPREILIPEIKAPEIPARIARAIEIFGHGNRESALRDLVTHPDCRGSRDGDELAIRRQLDSLFRSAWDRAGV